MPAPLIHIHGADQLFREGGLPEGFHRAVEQARWAYSLGALLVDLPLFEGFWLKVALFLVHRPYPESHWGTVTHTKGSASLAAALLRQAHGQHRQELLAVVAGLLTHIAFDRSMHPPVEDAVGKHRRPDETWAQLHEAIENYQSLVWHRRQFDCDGMGTPLLKSAIKVSPDPRSNRLPDWLSAAFLASLGEAYGAEPSARELRGWSAGICGYRDLLSTRVGQIGVRSSDRFGEERPWVAEVELETAFQRGISLSADYLETAAAAEGQTAAFVEAIGDGGLV